MSTKIEINTTGARQSIWGEIFDNEPAKFVMGSPQRFQMMQSVSNRFQKFKNRIQNI